jgi:hypothetical protein
VTMRERNPEGSHCYCYCLSASRGDVHDVELDTQLMQAVRNPAKIQQAWSDVEKCLENINRGGPEEGAGRQTSPCKVQPWSARYRVSKSWIEYWRQRAP